MQLRSLAFMVRSDSHFLFNILYVKKLPTLLLVSTTRYCVRIPKVLTSSMDMSRH